MGLEAGLNTYQYAEANPANLVDSGGTSSHDPDTCPQQRLCVWVARVLADNEGRGQALVRYMARSPVGSPRGDRLPVLGSRGVTFLAQTRGPLRAAGAAALVALSILASGCGRGRRASPLRPIVLIGVDGLESRLVLDLAREGRMPVVTRLMEQGAFGHLETFRPTMSPVIWTSVATGKRPEKHGITEFTKGGSKPELLSSRDRKTKALWNIFSDAGLTVHTVGWWTTFPAEPVRGVMVAQANTEGQLRPDGPPRPWKGTIVQGLDGQVTPRSRQNGVIDTAREVDESLPALTREVFGALPVGASQTSRWAWEQSQWSFRADMTYLRVTRQLLAEEEHPALLLVYFGSPDVAGHRYWRYTYPEDFDVPPSEEDVAAFGDVLPDTYAWVDSAIGEILASYADDPTVFIVSDHGMRAAHRRRRDWDQRGGFSGAHTRKRPGILIASGGEARRTPVSGGEDGILGPEDLATLGSVLDITPTVLALAHIPVGEDMDGTVLEGVLRKGLFDEEPPATVASHDTPQWLEDRPRQMLSTEAEEERLEQLRALGYIE